MGARAKSTYCDLSSFGPALFEIGWPDIYLGGPYGPVKDKMHWPELARRSEKCAGPALMSRAVRDYIPPLVERDGLAHTNCVTDWFGLVYYLKRRCCSARPSPCRGGAY